jgi:hypothetical protein
MSTILKEDKKYTFSDYFELNNPTKEIIEEFGNLKITKII